MQGAKKVKREKKTASDPDEMILINADKPVDTWEKLPGADLSGELKYYPEKFEKGQGKTKLELLSGAERTHAGWQILLLQDKGVIPGEGEGVMKGNRLQMESKGTNLYIPMAADQEVPSPSEYLAAMNEPEVGSPYKGEEGLTLEACLTMGIITLAQTGEIMDDYQGKGKISYLTGNYIDGGVPSAYFDRANSRVSLAGGTPGRRDDFCGVRSAVRVP